MVTKLLEKAIETVRRLPEARQDEAAEILLSMAAQDPDALQITEAQRRELARRLGDPEPRYATDEEVAEFYRKSGA